MGKIRMNSSGFGLCMNALRSGAFQNLNMPVHVMSRRLLQYATSVDSAIAIIGNFGVACTANFMLADRTGKHLDIECSPRGNTLILPCRGFVVHTNHLYGMNRPIKLIDHAAANSFSRLARIQELTNNELKKDAPVTFRSLRERLSDEEGTPVSICSDKPTGAVCMERMTTLACIMMVLTSYTGKLIVGRPCVDVPVMNWSLLSVERYVPERL